MFYNTISKWSRDSITSKTKVLLLQPVKTVAPGARSQLWLRGFGFFLKVGGGGGGRRKSCHVTCTCVCVCVFMSLCGILISPDRSISVCGWSEHVPQCDRLNWQYCNPGWQLGGWGGGSEGERYDKRRVNTHTRSKSKSSKSCCWLSWLLFVAVDPDKSCEQYSEVSFLGMLKFNSLGRVIHLHWFFWFYGSNRIKRKRGRGSCGNVILVKRETKKPTDPERFRQNEKRKKKKKKKRSYTLRSSFDQLSFALFGCSWMRSN